MSKKINWMHLVCRHGCVRPVVGLYLVPNGCICFPDHIQALCRQHAIKGLQNNEMTILVERESEGPTYSQVDPITAQRLSKKLS
jgi:hypothetical protein